MSRYIQKIIKDIKQDVSLNGNSVVVSTTHTIDGHEVAPFDPSGITPVTGDEITGDVNVDDSGHGVYPVTIDPNHGTPGLPPYNYNVPAPAHEEVSIVTVRRRYREVIRDYSNDNLNRLDALGVTFYAALNDGTELEVTRAEIFDPKKPVTPVTINLAQIAESKNQHFWTDTNGAHVTDDMRSSWDDEYDEIGHGTLAHPTLNNPWHNILLNSYGILLRKGLINLSAFSDSSVSFFDGLGNESNNILATFGVNGAQIGKSTEKHLVLDSTGVNAYNGDGTQAPIHASNIDADHADIETLKSSKADVNYLTANYALISDLAASNAKINNLSTIILSAVNADIDNLTADEIAATNISALNAALTHIEAGSATIQDLNTVNAFIEMIAASRITTNYLAANYADINLANVDTEWLDHGIIKEASISDAMIVGVSANKLTAGEIDASKIRVSNLMANNILVNMINNVPVSGATVADALSMHDTNINNINTRLDDELASLNARVDSQIETHTLQNVPTLNNYPANEWLIYLTDSNDQNVLDSDNDPILVEDLRASHVGDIAYVTNAGSEADGYSYRYVYDRTTNTYDWVLIKDNQITDFIQRMIDAEGKIDNLETFESTTSEWITDTDQGIQTIRNNVTTITGSINTINQTINSKVDTSTFQTVVDEINEQSSTINTLTTEVDTITNTIDDLATVSSVTTVTNLVNQVKQTADTNSASIKSLETTTSDLYGVSDTLIERVSSLNQSLDGFNTTVSNIYSDITDTNKSLNQLKASYAVCYTAATSSAKLADSMISYLIDSNGDYILDSSNNKIELLDTLDNFILRPGNKLSCTFVNENTAANPTLNINGTGAKPILSYTGQSLSEDEYKWKANSTFEFIYDGSGWRLQDSGSIKRLSAAETKIDQNSKSITLSATKTEVRESIENIQIGGRNLAKVTDQILSPTEYSGLTMYLSSPLVVDEKYILQLWNVDISHSGRTNDLNLSVYYCGGSVRLITFANENFDDGHADYLKEEITITSSIVSHTSVTNAGENKFIRFYNSVPNTSGTMNLTIGRVKLEKGTKPTDWTPAPEDMQTVEQAAAELKVTSDAISARVAKTDYTGNKLVSMINQTAEDVKIQANRIEINGLTVFSNREFKESLDKELNAISSYAESIGTDLVGYINSNEQALKSLNDLLKSQKDNQLDVWYYDVPPTLTGEPYNGWIYLTDSNNQNVLDSNGRPISIEDTRQNHIGDIYFDTINGYSYRFVSNNGNYEWVQIKDTDITYALNAAQEAQTTADNKRRIFTSTPTVPYDIGDLWVNGSQVKYASKARSTGSFTNSDWVLTATDDTKANSVSDTLSDYMSSNNTALNTLQQSLQGQIDSQVDIWYYSGEPTLSTNPASAWSDTATKDKHLGDLYFDTSKGYAYRFIKSGTNYSWSRIQDKDISTALSAANTAQTTADNKRRIFTSTPTVPYDIGDLWVNGSQVKYASKARSTGSFTNSDWVLTATDDTKANSVSDTLSDYMSSNNTALNTLQQSLQGQIDSQVDIWYYSGEPTLSTNPASAWSDTATKDKHLGDLYFDTSKGYAYRFIKSGTNYSWSRIQDKDISTALSAANTAQTTADNKRRIFTSTPTVPYDIGDLWVNGSQVKYASKARSTGSFTNSDWVLTATDDTKANSVSDTLSDYMSSNNTALNTLQQSLQGQIDSQVDIWYYSGEPTLSTNPASAWSDTATKDKHLGDLYFDTSKGYAYRFIKSGTNYSWSRIQDKDISTALSAANTAQTTADNKRRIFTSTPTVPYDIGDLWVNGSQVKYASKARSTGSFTNSDWVLTATDDTKANSVSDTLSDYMSSNNTALNTLQQSLQGQIDSQVDIWYYSGEPTLSTNPASAWSDTATKDKHLGDLYFDTSKGYAYRFIKSGTNYSWSRIKDSDITSALSAANTAQTTADNKRRIFTSTPTVPYDIGDLWVNGSQVKYASKARSTGSFTNSDWVLTATDDTKANSVSDTLSDYMSSNNTALNTLQQSLQGQIDSQVDIWYYSGEPTLSTNPASAWSDTATKDKHLGDLYFDTSKGYAYRFIKSGTNYSWSRIQDKDISTALSAANTAQTTADNKRRIFTSTPTVPYDIGDLWVNGTEIKYSSVKKSGTQTYSSSDWVLTATDDTAVNTINEVLYSYIASNNQTMNILQESIKNQLDSKVDIWYYSGEPTLDSSPCDEWLYLTDSNNEHVLDSNGDPILVDDSIQNHIGDLYFDTATGYSYKFDNIDGTYTWTKIQDKDISTALSAANTAQTTADNKRRIFTSTPTVPYDIGDLWVNGSQVKYASKARSTGSFTNSDWVLTATDDTAANSVSDTLSDYMSSNNTALNTLQQSLQGQIDSQVDIWYYSGEPTLSTNPASAWSDTATKDKHVGDLYFDTSKGYAYRFVKSGTNYSWSRIQDKDISTALSAANTAQTTADNKRRIFTSTPTVPYDIGDLWVNGSQVKYANQARTTGSFTSSDWVLTATDDTAANAVNDTLSEYMSSNNRALNTLQQSLQGQIDSQVDIWYYSGEPTLTTNPASSWSDTATKDKHLGDLYFDTSKGYAYRFIKSGTNYSWSRIQDKDIASALSAANTAQTTADNKRRIFTSTPTVPYDIGDLWVNGSQVKYANQARTTGSFTSSDWVLTATDDTAANAVNEVLYSYIASNNQTMNILQESIKNQLDSKVDIWYYSGEPTLDSSPCDEWLYLTDSNNEHVLDSNDDPILVDDSIQNHIGDLYFDIATGYSYKFDNIDGTYTWTKIQDKDIASALSAANTAQTTADNKRRIFTSTPTVPYDIGDLWVNGSQVKYANQARTTGSFTSSDWVLTATDDTKANSVSDTLSDYMSSNNTALNTLQQSLQGQIDSQVDIWYYSGEPTLSTNPASAWSDTATKDKHLGDLYFDTSKGYAYRFIKSGTNYSWSRIKDSDITSALSAANTAQTTADNKRRIFTSTPTVPYDIGDLWVNGSQVKYASKARSTGSFTNSDWVLTATDDTKANSVSDTLSDYMSSNNTALNTLQQSLQGQIDSQVDIWYYSGEPTLSTNPASAWSDTATKDKHLGDLYFDTSKGYAYRFIKSGTNYSWSRIQDKDISTALSAANTAQTTADNKRRIFTSTPTVPYDIGDLWVNGTEIKYSSVKKSGTQTYSSSDWVLTATDDTKANTAQTTADSKRRIFTSIPTGPYDVGDLWVNGTEIKYARRARTTGNFTDSDWVLTATDDTAANSVNDTLSDYISSNNKALDTLQQSLQGQIDSQVDIWYYSVEPTLDNNPASSWSDTATKDKHIGDLYFDTSKGYAYRFNKSGAVYFWSRIKDSDIGAALSAANTAQTTADNKRRIFTSTPTVPYDIGDLWVNGSQVKYASVKKSGTQTYSSSDWVLTATDDTVANSNINSSIILWKTKSVTTIDDSDTPTYRVSSTSTAGNGWRIVVPSYDKNYPYYFYCYQQKLADGSYKWTDVVYDRAMSDAQRMSREAAPKSSAVKRSQRIYYRSSSSVAPNVPGVTWITKTSDSWASNSTTTSNWTTKYSALTDSQGTKYRYMWTCVQSETVSGDISYSDVLIDDTETVIDGGNIITATIKANKLDVDDVNASRSLEVGAFTSDAQDDISNSTYITRIDDNGIKVHAKSNTSSNYTGINSYGMQIYKDGSQVASFGDTVLLGSTSTQGARINSSGMQIFKGGNQVVSFGENILLGNTSAQAARINSNGMQIYKGGNQVASFGDTVLLGLAYTQGATINSNGMQIYKGGNQVASFGDTVLLGSTSTQGATINSSGMQIYKSGNQVASFGDTVKLGKSNLSANISGDEFYFIENNNSELFRLEFTSFQYSSSMLEYYCESGQSGPNISIKTSYRIMSFYNAVIDKIYTDYRFNETQFMYITSDGKDYISGNGNCITIKDDVDINGYKSSLITIDLSKAENYEPPVSNAAWYYVIMIQYSINNSNVNRSPSLTLGSNLSNYKYRSIISGMHNEFIYNSSTDVLVLGLNNKIYHADRSIICGRGNDIKFRSCDESLVIGIANVTSASISCNQSMILGSENYIENTINHSIINGSQNRILTSARNSLTLQIFGDFNTISDTDTSVSTSSRSYHYVFGDGNILNAPQAVFGMYNKPGNYIFAIANGQGASGGVSTDNNPNPSMRPHRSNAFTVYDNGSAYINGTSTSDGSSVTSDKRVKTLIKNITKEESAKFISKLIPRKYYKKINDSKVKQTGFYAQDIEDDKDFGEYLVTIDTSDNYDIKDFRLLNYQGLIAPMVGAIQDLQDKVNELQQKNQELEDRLTRLEELLLKFDI